MVEVVETKEVVGTKAVAVEAADAVVAEREAVVAVAVVENANAIVVETKVVVAVAVKNANARMKAKMTNPQKVEPDQYHTPQSCMLILLSQLVASCCLIVKPENLKKT